MSTAIDCPSCRRKLRVPREFLGKTVRCPNCGETFLAPESVPEPAPIASESSPSATSAEPSPLVTVPLKLELDDPPAAKPAAEKETPKETPLPRRRGPERERERDDDRDERRSRRSLRRDFEPCPRCGDDIRRGAVVCPFCGLDLEEQGDGYTRRQPVRRDAEPHRGGTIQALGIASLIMGVVYCLSPIGLPLGIAALIMARRDLRKMEDGVMDPNGRKKTRDGRLCGIVGTVMTSIWSCIFLFGLCMIVLEESRPKPPVRPMPAPWPNQPPAWQNQPPPELNNFSLRGPQLVTLKRGETKVITINIDRAPGWAGNVSVAPVDMEVLDGLDVDPADEVKVARWQQNATFRIIAAKNADLGEQVVHFSATTNVGDDVRLDVRVNVVPAK